ncbi:uncharacterized protein EAE98_001553 [Botrytis deweyae]|uniref:Uncharacterized protein n=1 Tax=Botrytis deweyae TaxID=2478750 RepID=A0ABQ7IY71_9HELO|nr:uncharacterized protein EAE98_001553 [Botrytis deweyae]KAF7937239.1 hypothetical protein EAE98_001553 [Botrytis deweyae]
MEAHTMEAMSSEGIQDSGSKIQDPRFRIQDSGSKIQDPRFRIQDSGSKIQDPRFRIQDSGYMNTASLFSLTSHLPLLTSLIQSRGSRVGNQELETRNWKPGIGNQELETKNWKSGIGKINKRLLILNSEINAKKQRSAA